MAFQGVPSNPQRAIKSLAQLRQRYNYPFRLPTAQEEGRVFARLLPGLDRQVWTEDCEEDPEACVRRAPPMTRFAFVVMFDWGGAGSACGALDSVPIER